MRAVHDTDVVCAHGHAAAVPDRREQLVGPVEVIQGTGVTAPLIEGHPLVGLHAAGADVLGHNHLLFPAAGCREDHEEQHKTKFQISHSSLTS